MSWHLSGDMGWLPMNQVRLSTMQRATEVVAYVTAIQREAPSSRPPFAKT